MARIPAAQPNPEPAQPAAESSPLDDAIAKAAASMGFDPANIDDDTRSFIESFEGGELGSLEAGADPDNPLIPAEDPEGATPPVDADGVGVGLDPDASGADGSGGADLAATTPADDAIPPVVPPTVDPNATIEVNGQQVPIAQVQQWIAQQQLLTQEELNAIQLQRQGLLRYEFVDPATGLPVGAQQQQQPPDEWIDPQAQAAYQALAQQQQQLVANQRAVTEDSLMRERVAIAAGLEAGIDLFKTQRGIDDKQAAQLVESVATLGLIPVYERMYPGDPRSVIAASLEAVYWGTPEFRNAELQRYHAEQLALNADTDAKKAAGGAIASSPGSAPRVPAAPTTREGRDAGMVSAIEAAMANGN